MVNHGMQYIHYVDGNCIEQDLVSDTQNVVGYLKDEV